MPTDQSEGWDQVARHFMTARSEVGADLVLAWARENVARPGSIVDVGCGSGMPIAEAMMNEGFEVFGIDASPALAAAFRSRFPVASVACEAAQHSPFFHRSFDAAVSIGLLFLLQEENQRAVPGRIAAASSQEAVFYSPHRANDANGATC